LNIFLLLKFCLFNIYNNCNQFIVRDNDIKHLKKLFFEIYFLRALIAKMTYANILKKIPIANTHKMSLVKSLLNAILKIKIKKIKKITSVKYTFLTLYKASTWSPFLYCLHKIVALVPAEQPIAP